MTICIYTIGDQTNGFGHVMRELTLAVQLHQRGAAVTFVTPDGTPGLARLQRSPFAVLGHVDDSWSDVLPHAETLIVDVEHGPRRPFLERVRPHFKTLITVCGSGYSVDEPVAVDEFSDLVVEQNPFGHAGARTTETLTILDDPFGYAGTRATETLAGLDYILIDPQYAGLTPNPTGPIVLSMGGGDPYGLTQPIANALGAAGCGGLRVIVGPAAGEPDIRNGTPQLLRAPDSLLPILDGASLLIGALGMTAFEAAAAGVPALLVSWTADHERTARLFAERGAAINLGLAQNVNGAVLTELVGQVASLLNYGEAWSYSSQAARHFCDGQGAGRVADKVLELIGDV